MGEKIPLLKLPQFSLPIVAEDVMKHVYRKGLSLSARIADLEKLASKARLKRVDAVYDNPEGRTNSELKEKYWQKISAIDPLFDKQNANLGEVIQLPPWDRWFWEDMPVFFFDTDVSKGAYLIKISDLLIDPYDITHAQPIKADTAKILSVWPLENVKLAFSAMVEQGWLYLGSELLVEHRFTNSTLLEHVGENVPKFKWLKTLGLLRQVARFMGLEKAKLPPHFEYERPKGRFEAIKANALTSGSGRDKEYYSNVKTLLKLIEP